MFSINQKRNEVLTRLGVAEIPDITKEFELVYRITDQHYCFNESATPESYLAILSAETTGITPSDELIELGITICAYSPVDMKITRIVNAQRFFEQPSKPIHPEATKRHGHTAESLEGMRFPDDAIQELFTRSNCNFIIAHNAKFVRKYIDKRFAFLHDLSLKWTSLSHDVDWNNNDCYSTSLNDLAKHFGFSFEQRNTIASNAAVAVILSEAPESFKKIITALGKLTYRIYAFHAPFEVKDQLSLRGFEWDPLAGVWHKDLSDEDKEDELDFIYSLYFGADETVSIRVIDAENRYQ